MITQIIGLPGSGKTTLANKIVKETGAIHINADEIRKDLNSDLGFSIEDRIENARRLGAISRLLSSQGYNVVVDFVNPTDKTRLAFGKADYIIWMDTISSSRFADTDLIWEPPIFWDQRISSF